MDLEKEVLKSLTSKPKTTTTLMGEFSALGDRENASVFLNGMYRKGDIKREKGGFWRISDKGLKNSGVLPGPILQKSEAPSQTAIAPDSIAAIKETVEAIQGAKLESKAGTTENSYGDITKALLLLSSILQEGCALLVKPDAIYAIFDDLQFELTDQPDIDAFARLTSRYCGKVAS